MACRGHSISHSLPLEPASFEHQTELIVPSLPFHMELRRTSSGPGRFLGGGTEASRLAQPVDGHLALEAHVAQVGHQRHLCIRLHENQPVRKLGKKLGPNCWNIGWNSWGPNFGFSEWRFFGLNLTWPPEAWGDMELHWLASRDTVSKTRGTSENSLLFNTLLQMWQNAFCPSLLLASMSRQAGLQNQHVQVDKVYTLKASRLFRS